MSQPIDVGSVLSGRYQVTETVLSSAEGDLVLGGIDQVLNRSVSIMVASAENSSQLATSAREIAMGERASNVQVLDLGITDSNQSYLVANVARSSDLLDLVLETDDAPYVEPFFTDTLGTEIFGESRQAIPETYEDDDRSQYDDGSDQTGKFGTALSSGFAGLKNRFGKKNSEQPEAEPSEETAPNEQVPATTATPVAPTEEEPATDDDPKTAAAGSAAAGAGVADASSENKADGRKAKEESSSAGAATQSMGQAPAQSSQKPASKQKPKDQEEEPTKKKGAVAAGAAAGAGAAAASAKPSTFPAAAKNVPAGTESADEQEDDSTSKGTRILVGAVLLIVLIFAVVFAFNFLGSDKETTADNGEPTAVESSEKPADSDEPEKSTEPALPEPVVADVSRLVPGNQSLNAETDATLGDMIDGNVSSAYNTYSFTTSNFGGFASNMVFILELEEESAISEISLEGLNATGGDYEILVGTSDDLGDAKSVAKGSFSGPSISVDVKDGDKGSMAGTHVFLNVTDLPTKASGGNDSRPYGLQIGEFSAK